MTIDIDEGISPEALELFGAIVTHNVDEARRISDILIAHHERDAHAMAKRFIDLYEAIERIPPMIRSSYLDELLEANHYAIDSAYRLLEEPPS